MHTHAWIHTSTHTWPHMYGCTCMYTCTDAHPCQRTHADPCTHLHAHTHVHCPPPHTEPSPKPAAPSLPVSPSALYSTTAAQATSTPRMAEPPRNSPEQLDGAPGPGSLPPAHPRQLVAMCGAATAEYTAPAISLAACQGRGLLWPPSHSPAGCWGESGARAGAPRSMQAPACSLPAAPRASPSPVLPPSPLQG